MLTEEQALKILKQPDRIGCHMIKANDEDSCKFNQENLDALNVAIATLEQRVNGICKNCEHWCHIDGYENLDTCRVTFKTRHKDYYCADFEKRGSENE